MFTRMLVTGALAGVIAACGGDKKKADDKGNAPLPGNTNPKTVTSNAGAAKAPSEAVAHVRIGFRVDGKKVGDRLGADLVGQEISSITELGDVSGWKTLAMGSGPDARFQVNYEAMAKQGKLVFTEHNGKIAIAVEAPGKPAKVRWADFGWVDIRSTSLSESMPAETREEKPLIIVVNGKEKEMSQEEWAKVLTKAAKGANGDFIPALTIIETLAPKAKGDVLIVDIQGETSYKRSQLGADSKLLLRMNRRGIVKLREHVEGNEKGRGISQQILKIVIK